MRYSELVKTNDPVVYTIINNALKNNKVPHAYLFSAQQGQNIEEEYLFVAQELISVDGERNPLAYSDLTILDGSESLIKKEKVSDAIARLQQTSLDSSGVKILVIKNIENSNKQSINSLLKFIEEPTENTYILITTNNLASVLSTIKSRSQVVSIKPVNVNKMTDILMEEGIDESDARLLANISSSKKEAFSIYNENFHNHKKLIISAMKKGLVKPESLITELAPLFKKTAFKIQLNILREFISDIWREEQLLPLSFVGEKELIQKYILAKYDFSKALEAINSFVVMRAYHVNFDLDKNKMIITLGECYE